MDDFVILLLVVVIAGAGIFGLTELRACEENRMAFAAGYCQKSVLSNEYKNGNKYYKNIWTKCGVEKSTATFTNDKVFKKDDKEDAGSGWGN